MKTNALIMHAVMVQWIYIHTTIFTNVIKKIKSDHNINLCVTNLVTCFIITL